MKKQQNNHQAEERNFNKKRIEQLEKQLEEASSRESQLRINYQHVKKALQEITHQKKNILAIINGDKRNACQKLERELQMLKINTRLTQEQNSLKIDSLEQLNKQYEQQNKRLEQQLKNQIKQLNLKHQREKQIMEKKIAQYLLTIEKYKNVYDDSEIVAKDAGQLIKLKQQNRNLKSKLKQLEINSLSTIIPDNNNESVLKNSFHNNSFISDIQNYQHHTNRKLNDSTVYSRISLNKDKSKMALDNLSSIKPKSIATTIHCEICETNYAPNEFYRHMKIHTNREKEQSQQFETLLQEKNQIQEKMMILSKGANKKELENQLKSIEQILKKKHRPPMQSLSKQRLR